ncbi:MAG: class D sortase [Acidobacteria bacterium]|nr:class D sortase [Acidobacteriota bacterium]
MTARTALLSIERLLLAAGVALGLWCAAQVLDARYVQRMPVPPPHRTALPADAQPPPDRSAAAARHLVVLAAGTWVGRLEAPSVGMTATILEGSSDETLARGAGHIEETPLPGEPGNFGVAGHRDTTFRPVRRLKVGDPLVVTTQDGIFHYRVTKTMVVDPQDVWVLDPASRPTLTLVTCYPFVYIGRAPRRYIVSADLEKEERR